MAAGMGDVSAAECCVADGLDGYVARAVRLGSDAVWREKVGAAVQRARGALYDAPGVADELGRFFERAAGV